MSIIEFRPRVPPTPLPPATKPKTESLKEIAAFTFDQNRIITYGEFRDSARAFVTPILSALESGAAVEEIQSALLKFASHTKQFNDAAKAANVLEHLYCAYDTPKQGGSDAELAYTMGVRPGLETFQEHMTEDIMDTIGALYQWLRQPSSHNAKGPLALIK